jgi:hypothetical protein
LVHEIADELTNALVIEEDRHASRRDVSGRAISDYQGVRVIYLETVSVDQRHGKWSVWLSPFERFQNVIEVCRFHSRHLHQAIVDQSPPPIKTPNPPDAVRGLCPLATNPKFQIRNPKQIQITEIANDRNVGVSNIGASYFRFVSDFDIRISCFTAHGSLCPILSRLVAM